MTNVVFWVSLMGLFALIVQRFRKSRNIAMFLGWLAVLAACGGVYFYAFESPSHLQAKGEQSSGPAMIVLYICMLVGMACHYLYSYFVKPKLKRESFEFGLLIAPVFASPIIFAPLWAAFQDAGVTLSPLRYAAFFVAFENGFFWKEFFDNRSRRRQ
jgi:hypothetical protein